MWMPKKQALICQLQSQSKQLAFSNFVIVISATSQSLEASMVLSSRGEAPLQLMIILANLREERI